jgi:5'-nucleotidase
MSTTTHRLVIAVSSRALFDLSEHASQQTHNNSILKPGVAFALIHKLLALNTPVQRYVDVILLSRHSAEVGLRVFSAIHHYQLDITQAAFTRGASTARYVAAFGAQLFLSADTEDVQRVLADGCAAAIVLPNAGLSGSDQDSKQFRVAFDGDAPLFGHTPASHTTGTPSSGGAFKPLLAALQRIQMAYPEDQVPLRTALVTERPVPANQNVVDTLNEWNIRIDEAFFLGGLDKSTFLKMFGADIFLDGLSTPSHTEQSTLHTLPATPPTNVRPAHQEATYEPVFKESFTLPDHSSPLSQTPPSTPSYNARPTRQEEASISSPSPLAEHDFSSFVAPTPAYSSSYEDHLLNTHQSLTSEEHVGINIPSSTLSELNLVPLHLDSAPIIDGTPPKPSVSAQSAPVAHKNPQTEEVWLFDKTNANTSPIQHTPTPLPTQPIHTQHDTLLDDPLLTPTPHTHTPIAVEEPLHTTPTPSQKEAIAQTPPSQPQASTHTAHEPQEEHILSTEEILRRFARKMTEGQKSSPPPTSPSTSSSSTPASKPASPQPSKPQPASKPNALENFSEADLLQSMLADDPLMPSPATRPATPTPHSAPVQQQAVPNPFATNTSTPPNQPSPSVPSHKPAETHPRPTQNNTASTSKPAAPNPFAIMTDFDEK